MTTTFTWTREDGSEIPIEIEFTCSRYYPATYFEPAEGGEIEDIEFTADESECPPEQLAEFKALYEAGGGFAEKVNEACYEATIDGCYDDADY